MDKAVAVLGSRFACRSKCVCSHNINISTCPPILGDTMDNDAAVLASRLFAAATVSAAKPSRTQPFSLRQMCPQPIFTCPPALGGVDSAGLLSLQGTARSEHIKNLACARDGGTWGEDSKTLPIDSSANHERDLAWDLHARRPGSPLIRCCFQAGFGRKFRLSPS